MIGNVVLRWEELQEVVLDVEIAVNNRPLEYLKDDIQLPLLTPNAMLCQFSKEINEIAIIGNSELFWSLLKEETESYVLQNCVLYRSTWQLREPFEIFFIPNYRVNFQPNFIRFISFLVIILLWLTPDDFTLLGGTSSW